MSCESRRSVNKYQQHIVLDGVVEWHSITIHAGILLFFICVSFFFFHRESDRYPVENNEQFLKFLLATKVLT